MEKSWVPGGTCCKKLECPEGAGGGKGEPGVPPKNVELINGPLRKPYHKPKSLPDPLQ